MEVEVANEQAKKLQRAADIIEIQMLMGQFVTCLEKMDGISIWENLYVHDNPKVSVELGDYGGYVGTEHVKEFFAAYDAYLKNPDDKRGWFDMKNLTTPYVIISNNGNSAYGSWSCFGPQSKQAMPYPSQMRTLTAIWNAAKYVCDFVKTDDGWKILTLREVVYIRSPFELGWIKQPDCIRSEPLNGMMPDMISRPYTYHPDALYSPKGLYNWGPFPPEEGSF